MPAEYICEVFSDSHDASQLASGQSEIDDWLRKSAQDSDRRNLTRSYIWHRGDGIVVAFYSIMPYFIERETLSKKHSRGLPNGIPCYLIARLALDQQLQHQRLGSQLLASALERAAKASSEIGGRYVVVDALNDEVASFYVRHGFEPVPGQQNRLVLPTKSIPIRQR